MNAFRHGFRWTLCAAVAAFGFCSSLHAQPAGSRGITIDFKSVKNIDEDDPLSHDEPYLIVTKFRFKVETVGGVRIVPGTLRVANVMSGHGSLGNKEDNFTREGRTWEIPKTSPRLAQEVVPPNEPGWVVGAAVTYMEKDGFSAATARLVSDRVRNLVQSSIISMSFTEKDSKKLTDAIIRKVSGDLTKSLHKLDVGGIIRGVASAVDPDDYGGTALIVAVTGEGGSVYSYVGLPTADLGTAVGATRPISGTVPFMLSFPMGDLSRVPSNARFQGRAHVNGEIRIWKMEAPF